MYPVATRSVRSHPLLVALAALPLRNVSGVVPSNHAIQPVRRGVNMAQPGFADATDDGTHYEVVYWQGLVHKQGPDFGLDKLRGKTVKKSDGVFPVTFGGPLLLEPILGTFDRLPTAVYLHHDLPRYVVFIPRHVGVRSPTLSVAGQVTTTTAAGNSKL